MPPGGEVNISPEAATSVSEKYCGRGSVLLLIAVGMPRKGGQNVQKNYVRLCSRLCGRIVICLFCLQKQKGTDSNSICAGINRHGSDIMGTEYPRKRKITMGFINQHSNSKFIDL